MGAGKYYESNGMNKIPSNSSTTNPFYTALMPYSSYRWCSVPKVGPIYRIVDQWRPKDCTNSGAIESQIQIPFLNNRRLCINPKFTRSFNAAPPSQIPTMYEKDGKGLYL